jgi:hypothetical protein
MMRTARPNTHTLYHVDILEALWTGVLAVPRRG